MALNLTMPAPNASKQCRAERIFIEIVQVEYQALNCEFAVRFRKYQK